MTEERGLERQLGLWTATGVVVAGMIGTGIITISGFMAADVPHPGWMLGLWLLGGVLALAGALSVGELSAMFPKAGGNYIFVSEGYGPMWGFLSGWTTLIVGFSAPVAAGALGAMEYFSTYVPALSPVDAAEIPIGIGTLKVSWGHLAGAAAIVIFGSIHYVGVRFGAFIQNSMTILKFGVWIVIVAAGFIWGAGDWSHLQVDAGVPAAAEMLPKAGVSLIFVMFAYTGWDSATYIAGEIKQPGRNLPLSLLLGTLGVVVLYLAMNLLYLYALPVSEMAGKLAIGSVVFQALLGESAILWTDGILALSLLAAVSAYLLIGPRVYYAMARDRVFMPAFGRVHPKYGTPSRAIVLQMSFAILLMFTGTFDQLLLYIGFCLTLFATLAVAAVYVLRWRRPDHPRPYRTWGYPITPALFIIVSVWMMTYTLLERPAETLWGIGTVAAGLPFYWYYRKHKSTG